MLRDDDVITGCGLGGTEPPEQSATDERSILFDERLAGSGKERLTCRLFGPDFRNRPTGEFEPRLLTRMSAVVEWPQIGLRPVAPPEIERGI
jgi:hypothetical protein